MTPKKDDYMRGYGDGYKDGTAAMFAFKSEAERLSTLCIVLRGALEAIDSEILLTDASAAPVKADWERIAFNLCVEFGSEFVADKQDFARAVVREYLSSLSAEAAS